MVRKLLKNLLPDSTRESIRRVVTGYHNFKYAFSESGEDLILLNIFGSKIKRKEKGFYIDIGAYDPHRGSNTQLLYMHGWQGINIDPKPGTKKIFDKYRPKDINLEVAVSGKEETVSYFVCGVADTLNSISRERFSELNIADSIKEEIQVPALPLSAIIEKYVQKGQVIDFLNIDVEGFDLVVLNSNDWTKYKPGVIAVEIDGYTASDFIQSETAQYLFNLGYEFCAKTYILPRIATGFFIHKDYYHSILQ
jgi:FkbM family methyltransferase